jgi:DnaJ-class molecular chaperone
VATGKKATETRHHYETMGLNRGSTRAEVTARWKELARELHPDRHLHSPQPYAAAFAAVSQAYAVLGDEGLRKRYDAALDLASKPCDGCRGEGRTWKQKGFAERIPTPCATCGGSGRTTKKTR